jgi:hypothetical protein
VCCFNPGFVRRLPEHRGCVCPEKAAGFQDKHHAADWRDGSLPLFIDLSIALRFCNGEQNTQLLVVNLIDAPPQ